MTADSRRSSEFLRVQLALREATESARLKALGRKPSVETEPFDYYAHERALTRIRELKSELKSREGRE